MAVIVFFFMSFQTGSAFAGKHPWDRAPKDHTFNLKDFEGKFKLIGSYYSEDRDKDFAGKDHCPGSYQETIIPRYYSVKENRGGKMYYNEAISFGNSKLEHIDQGKDILEYSNGPHPLLSFLGCRIIPMSVDCDREAAVNREYYYRNGILSEDTRIEKSVYSQNRAVISEYQSEVKTNRSDRSDSTLVKHKTILELTDTGAVYTDFSKDNVVRKCLYEKIEPTPTP